MQPSLIITGPLPFLQFGDIRLPTYQVYMALMLCGLVLFLNWRADKKEVSASSALDLFIGGLASGAIGARLFHIFYEEPAYYWENPWRVFYFWQGGFVYYAGLIAGLLGGYIILKIKKESFALWADFLAPVVSLGYALGRLGCFLEGCCYGKVCDLPWAYPFGQLNLDTHEFLLVPRHPTQLYALVMELIVFATLLYLEKRKTFSQKPGALFMFWLLVHGLSRILMEFLRDDDRGFVLLGMSVSTLLSLILIFTSGLYFLRNRASLKR